MKSTSTPSPPPSLLPLLLLTLTLTLFQTPHPTHADTGTCRYETDACSCKLGAANQGTCWDPHPITPGTCTQRPCRAGWTCACGSRTHVCQRVERTIHTPTDPDDAHSPLAVCHTTTVPLAASRTLTLGSLHFHLSRTGVAAGDCGDFAWWHNGELIGAHEPFGENDVPAGEDVDVELAARQDHSLLELQPGDLIAFRLRNTSYYCYKHLIDINVNGTATSTIATGFTTHYARNYSQDWYLPATVLTAENTGVDEEAVGEEFWKFVPVRGERLMVGGGSGGGAIVPGEDYWESADGSDANRVLGSWYFRVQVPSDV